MDTELLITAATQKLTPATSFPEGIYPQIKTVSLQYMAMAPSVVNLQYDYSILFFFFFFTGKAIQPKRLKYSNLRYIRYIIKVYISMGLSIWFSFNTCRVFRHIFNIQDCVSEAEKPPNYFRCSGTSVNCISLTVFNIIQIVVNYNNYRPPFSKAFPIICIYIRPLPEPGKNVPEVQTHYEIFSFLE